MSNTRKLGPSSVFRIGIHVKKLRHYFCSVLLVTAASAQTDTDDDDILLQVVSAIVAFKHGVTNIMG